jgi:hypothetical protein
MVSESVDSYCREGTGRVRDSEGMERLPLEAVSRRLVKTQKTENTNVCVCEDDR